MNTAFQKALAWLCLFTFSAMVCAENWPAWRGPRHDGTSLETGLPHSWSREEGVLWRYALPGPGPSTPVIWGDRIFMTGADGDNLMLFCIDTQGKPIWSKQLGKGNYDIRQGESNASAPSPTTDGDRVWALTGTGILACFDMNGEEVWRADIQDRYKKFNMYHGFSTSPVLDGNRLYLQLLHTDAQLLVALDKADGSEIWQHERPSDAKMESLHSYTTPYLYRFGDEEFMLTHGSDYIVAHSLKDGGELWRCGGLQTEGAYNNFFRLVASPVAVKGLIVAPSAKNGPVLGLNPAGAEGNITGKSGNYHWKREGNTPDVPSPLIHDGLVYLCRENGVLICMDAQTGKEIYQERTHEQRHRGSPVYADGKLYLTAADGMVTVVKAGKTFEILAQNDMQERLAASPAIAGGTLYLRSYDALYAIR